MDTAGFHGIDEALNETKKIETSYPSTVNRVKKIVRQISWPEALWTPSHALDKALDELSSALEADNAEDAAKAAKTVHETQHDLSHAIDEWATTQQPVAGDVFNVRVAQYLMDTAGFHGIDEALNETKKIETSYPSTVSRVKKIVAQISWPTELNEKSQEFIKALEELSAALEADNAEDAAKAATTAHETQHELSHAIDDWAVTQQVVVGSDFDVRVAQYLMDTAGFHGIDEALNETKKIETSYPSTVSRVKKLVAQLSWPTALDAPAEALLKSLDELSAALEADNAEDAAKAATTVHEAQHDLSHAIDEALGSDDAHNH
jgi:predicted chitinase